MHKRTINLVLVVGLRPQNDASYEVFHVAGARLVVVAYQKLLDFRVRDRLSMVKNRTNLVYSRGAESRDPIFTGAHLRWRWICDLLVDGEPDPAFERTVGLAAAFAEARRQRVGQKVDVGNHQCSLEADQQFQEVTIIVSNRQLLERLLVVVHLLLLSLLRDALVSRRVVDLIVVESIRLQPQAFQTRIVNVIAVAVVTAAATHEAGEAVRAL